VPASVRRTVPGTPIEAVLVAKCETQSSQSKIKQDHHSMCDVSRKSAITSSQQLIQFSGRFNFYVVYCTVVGCRTVLGSRPYRVLLYEVGLPGADWLLIT